MINQQEYEKLQSRFKARGLQLDRETDEYAEETFEVSMEGVVIFTSKNHYCIDGWLQGAEWSLHEMVFSLDL